MTILRRYLFRSILIPILVSSFILVGLDGLIRFVGELQALGGNYQAFQALQYVLTEVPQRFSLFLPVAILLGTLFGLGMLANSSELTVIRSSGPSLRKLCVLILWPVLVMLVVGGVVGEFVAPQAKQLAESRKDVQQGDSLVMRSGGGYWVRQGNEFVHFNAVQPNGVLFGITRLIFDGNHHLLESQFAKRGIYQGDGLWVLQDVTGTRLGGEEISTYQRSSLDWYNDITPDRLSVIIVDPKDLSLRRQWEYANYLNSQGLTADQYLLSFWQKVFMPLATIGMVLIAISFIFGPLREVSMGARLTAGIIAGLLFHYGQQFFGNLSLVFHASPFIAGAAPPAICIAVGIWMLRRVR